MDFFSLAITTFGVGYLPVAPGTYGSVVGVAIYLIVAWAEAGIAMSMGHQGWRFDTIAAWGHGRPIDRTIWKFRSVAGSRRRSNRATDRFSFRAFRNFAVLDPRRILTIPPFRYLEAVSD